MNAILKGTLTSAIAIAIGISIVPSASSSPNLARDTLVGAGTNSVLGGLQRNGDLLPNALGGAATGAAVNATRNASPRSTRAGSLAQDVAVGAATSTVAGALLDNGDPLPNAISGAASGAIINTISGGPNRF
ncbi:hypothetical protein [Synechococcus sp. PCC 7336]|uniref:hypothetical protein n=1 Tax=Synechococcus sp. PCC 7336 TaxID=195250 RepID=UPI000347198B|nr:hypothetical protein [Synechococcus sp. PCC 7336]